MIFLPIRTRVTTLTTSDFSGSWMWSEPIAKNQLLQLEYAYSQGSEKRNKEVVDNIGGEQQFNDFLSAKGDYFNRAHDAELKHKFLSDGFNTTIGVDYKYLNLSGDSIFSAPQNFQYILPSARIQWDATKNGNLRLSL